MCGDMLQLLRPLDCQEAVASSSCHVLPQFGHSQGFPADVESLQHACTARCNTPSSGKGVTQAPCLPHLLVESWGSQHP